MFQYFFAKIKYLFYGSVNSFLSRRKRTVMNISKAILVRVISSNNDKNQINNLNLLGPFIYSTKVSQKAVALADII